MEAIGVLKTSARKFVFMPKLTDKRGKDRSFLFLPVLLFIFAFLISVIRSTTEQQNVAWDYAVHLNNTFYYLELLQTHQWGKWLQSYFYYPPFVYWISSLLVSVFGYSRIYSTLLYFPIWASSIYLLYKVALRYLEEAKVTFLLLVFLLVGVEAWKLAAPWELMLDFPQMLFVFIGALLCLQGISSPKITWRNLLSTALVVSISLLTKWTALLFLFVPLSIFSAKLVKEKQLTKLFLLGCLTVFLPYFIWYGPNFHLLQKDALFYSNQLGFIEKDPQGFQSSWLYVKNFVRLHRISLVLILAAIFHTGLFYREKYRPLLNEMQKEMHKKWYALLFLLFPFIIFTFFIHNKDLRYLLPLHLLFLMTVWSVISLFLSRQIIRWWSIAVAMVIFVLLFRSGMKKEMALPFTDRVLNIALEKDDQNVYYFFEDDTIFFNYANTELRHKEHNLAHPELFLGYYQLNVNGAGVATKDNCVLPKEGLSSSDLVAVYSQADAYMPWHASFEQACQAILSQLKLSKDLFDPKQGELKVYEVQ